eukprot:355608-Pleurochrysis_carterae.AAC.3
MSRRPFPLLSHDCGLRQELIIFELLTSQTNLHILPQCVARHHEVNEAHPWPFHKYEANQTPCDLMPVSSVQELRDVFARAVGTQPSPLRRRPSRFRCRRSARRAASLVEEGAPTRGIAPDQAAFGQRWMGASSSRGCVSSDGGACAC